MSEKILVGGGRRKKFLSREPKVAEKGPPTQNMPKSPVFLRYATDPMLTLEHSHNHYNTIPE